MQVEMKNELEAAQFELEGNREAAASAVVNAVVDALLADSQISQVNDTAELEALIAMQEAELAEQRAEIAELTAQLQRERRVRERTAGALGAGDKDAALADMAALLAASEAELEAHREATAEGVADAVASMIVSEAMVSNVAETEQLKAELQASREAAAEGVADAVVGAIMSDAQVNNVAEIEQLKAKLQAHREATAEGVADAVVGAMLSPQKLSSTAETEMLKEQLTEMTAELEATRTELASRPVGKSDAEEEATQEMWAYKRQTMELQEEAADNLEKITIMEAALEAQNDVLASEREEMERAIQDTIKLLRPQLENERQLRKRAVETAKKEVAAAEQRAENLAERVQAAVHAQEEAARRAQSDIGDVQKQLSAKSMELAEAAVHLAREKHAREKAEANEQNQRLEEQKTLLELKNA